MWRNYRFQKATWLQLERDEIIENFKEHINKKDEEDNKQNVITTTKNLNNNKKGTNYY